MSDVQPDYPTQRSAPSGSRPSADESGAEFSRLEEWLHSISHGIGAALSLAGMIVLIVLASIAAHVDPWKIVSVSLYGSCLLLLYTASTLYHGFRRQRLKRVFQAFDHCAIYLLIAGTYTPFTLGALRGRWGWMLLGAIWSLALIGLAFKATAGMRYEKLSTGLYLFMGWLALLVIKPLWQELPAWGIFWLLAGGIFYTVGVAFYATDHLPYNHFRWHLFVIAGTACHFVAVLKYAA